MKERFRKIATSVSNIAGSAWAFCLAFLVIGIWAISGPLFDFSDTWQLIINTGTTIVTFLMVFLIQSTQNRDGRAMQLKLDELLRVTKARHTFIDVEQLSDIELEALAAEFSRIPKTEENSALIQKVQASVQHSLTKRRSIPGEQAAAEFANRFNPFGEHGDKKPKK